MKVKSVYFFGNGNTPVFDERGNQIPKLQKAWLLEFKKVLKRNKVENLHEIELNLPDGKATYLENYDNWSFESKKVDAR